MTARDREAPGSGPGGLVVPGDLDEDEELGPLEGRMARVEALLEALVQKVPYRADVETLAAERHRGFIELRGKLTDLSCDVARISVPTWDTAKRHDVEEMARTQREEFAGLRECHAWLRGAVTAGAQGRAPRSGVMALCMLWAIGAFAAFAIGVVAVGLVSVSVQWNGNGQPESALQRRLPPPLSDVIPLDAGDVVVPADRAGSLPERMAPSVGERPALPPVRDPVPGEAGAPARSLSGSMEDRRGAEEFHAPVVDPVTSNSGGP